jgi:hypothetical protein
MLDTATLVGVTTTVVVAISPEDPETVSVYVLLAVRAGVGYECPLTAAAVISELPAPEEPITAVPPENVGIRVTCPLNPGAVELATKLTAVGCTAPLPHPDTPSNSPAKTDNPANSKWNTRFRLEQFFFPSRRRAN